MKEGTIVDSRKWKSVSVPVELYKFLQADAENNDRSVAKQVAYILKKKYVAQKSN
mgnify:CR=1 FL=1|tara:strand:+ start:423 stop:587 length:165 start_codon:yes stop_codon:yes gene_type:complete